MSQDNVSVALPENLKEFVLEQVAQGGYGTVSEYVHALIHADQKRKAQERLESLLIEGIEGGDPTPLTSAAWNDIRAQVKARLSKNA